MITSPFLGSTILAATSLQSGFAAPTQCVGGVYCVAKNDHCGHIGEGGVVGFLLAFGDAHGSLDLVAALSFLDAAQDPICDARENRPALLSQVLNVARDIRMESKCPRHIERHMILMPRRRAGHRSRFLSRGRRALPRKLQASPAAQAGVAGGASYVAASVIENTLRDVGLQETERRNNERFDVPHHMAIIIVVVVPGRETEDGGRSGRGDMR